MAHTELKRRVRIEGKGRVVIPASFRSALGLKIGDEIDLRIEDDEIRISTLAKPAGKIPAAPAKVRQTGTTPLRRIDCGTTPGSHE